MQPVRLYGKGAVTLHSGKDVIRSGNGYIDVPANLVARVLAMGFTRDETGPDVPEVPDRDELAKIDAPSVAALASSEVEKTEADRAAIYRKEATSAGYTGDAVDQIVAERLRFDDLIASGKSEDEAASLIWGGAAAEPSALSILPIDPATKVVGDPEQQDVKAIVDADLDAAKVAGNDPRISKAR